MSPPSDFGDVELEIAPISRVVRRPVAPLSNLRDGGHGGESISSVISGLWRGR